MDTIITTYTTILHIALVGWIILDTRERDESWLWIVGTAIPCCNILFLTAYFAKTRGLGKGLPIAAAIFTMQHIFTALGFMYLGSALFEYANQQESEVSQSVEQAKIDTTFDASLLAHDTVRLKDGTLRKEQLVHGVETRDGTDSLVAKLKTPGGESTFGDIESIDFHLESTPPTVDYIHWKTGAVWRDSRVKKLAHDSVEGVYKINVLRPEGVEGSGWYSGFQRIDFNREAPDEASP